MFRNCKNYSDLLNDYFMGKPLLLLDKAGEMSSRISNYKILKLSSAWQS